MAVLSTCGPAVDARAVPGPPVICEAVQLYGDKGRRLSSWPVSQLLGWRVRCSLPGLS